jgi:hypothetical protein
MNNNTVVQNPHREMSGELKVVEKEIDKLTIVSQDLPPSPSIKQEGPLVC